ncbi:aminocarboxymuconate-semialdehyde decarboxylase [Pandoraea cepalis]|uniref:Aminocarboxymuconate-semialdehyde decarboxylase n=2 Tax=Pandoraea cepalis TaxID=2508294 RepID=A0A5E4TB86_9BURK|nr:aminocarboxymuconate-semialdehyde decarboxylase [Pandoraea cepalis]
MEITRIALDVHAHLAPIDEARLSTMANVQWDGAARRLTLDGHTIGLSALFSPAALIEWMDQQGVAQAWVSIPPPMYRQSLDQAASSMWCSFVNDGLRGVCERFPSRLSALLHLPLEHPELATRLVLENNGAFRYAAAAGGYEGALSDAAYEPLWAALNAQSAFLFLHPGQCCDTRLSKFYLENLMGNPVETTVAASHLAFGGVAVRYPEIRFCLAHGGGATAMLAGRYERGYRTSRPGVDVTLPSPRGIFSRFFVDCITHDDGALALSESIFGSENVVFGSDWPFPMGLLNPHDDLSGLDESRRHAILTRNASTLLKE